MMNRNRNVWYLICLLFCLLQPAAAQRFSTDVLLNQFKLAEQNVVLMENLNDMIPLKRLDSLRIAYIPFGFDTLEVQGAAYLEGSDLPEYLGYYTAVTAIAPPKNKDATAARQWAQNLHRSFNLVILGIKNYTIGINDPMPWIAYSDVIEQVCAEIPAVAVVVGRRQNAAWPNLQKAKSILSTTHTGLFQQSVAAQIIFGGLGAKGRLPFSIAYFPQGTGFTTSGGLRLSFTLPELAGMNGQLLQDSIRAIIEEGIREGAFPGAQVLVAKDGQVVYHEVFGNHTYESAAKVKKDDLYDFASLTKITGALPALMRLHSDRKFDLDAPMRRYIKVSRSSNKADLSFRQLLAHNGRLRASIPFWVGTLKSSAKYPWESGWNPRAVNDGQFRNRTFQADSTRNYNIRITDQLWLHRKYPGKMFKAIERSPLNEKPGYVYSDLTFVLAPKVISGLSGRDYQEYLNNTFYHRLGAYTLVYNPMQKFPLERIIPTENDTFFRHRQVWGTVHDEGAAMLKGVSGHAGLFGTTIDLAKMMQMYMNYGTYGGERYIAESTLKEFTRCQYCEEGNRRGLGFDKRPRELPEGGSYMAPSASELSFGHTGFTGTFTWADPANGLLVIFMTNRVYPTRDRQKLAELGLRPRLHEAVYQAVKEKEN